tara:strand:- start:100 stop:1683 length:1584 start_codon:yes stop_codon:yes gene_type:complete
MVIKFLIFFLFNNVIFSDKIKNNKYNIIPYDWSNQFGEVLKDGHVIWNNDWNSGNIFFDGTFANFPSTYGPKIENDFLNDTIKILGKDTVFSYFDYNQGDYLLDELAIGSRYVKKERMIEFSAFKRSFVGKNSQYLNSSSTPLQQSYVFNYQSDNKNDLLLFSLGYFDTNTGLPDSTGSSYLNSKIISSNLCWKNSFKKSSISLGRNDFLQRYRSDHSLSLTSRSRYLSRARYYVSYENSLVNNLGFSMYLEQNIRTVVNTSPKLIKWKNYSINISGNDFFIILGNKLIHEDNNPYYNLIYSKESKRTKLIFKLISDVNPLHSSFIDNISILKDKSYSFEANSKIWVMNIRMLVSKGKSSFNYSGINNTSNNIYSLSSTTFKLFPGYNAKIRYIKNLGEGYSSSGPESEIGLILNGQTKLFKNNLKVYTQIEVLKINGYNSNFSLNPVELIPMRNIDNQPLTNNWGINISIISKIKNFNIKYKIHNIPQLFLSPNTIDGQIFSSIVTPYFPDRGKLISFAVEWHFSD